jgi:hypothetical protein
MKFSLKSVDLSRKTRRMGFGIEALRDCAHVKSALPFHIRENLTGQGFWIWEKERAPVEYASHSTPVEHPEGTPVKYASLLQE